MRYLIKYDIVTNEILGSGCFPESSGHDSSELLGNVVEEEWASLAYQTYINSTSINMDKSFVRTGVGTFNIL